MPATKVTNLFHAATTDFDGNGKRIAGFSESFYSPLAVDSTTLQTQWTALCNKRAALMAKNVSIIGGRYQTVDPVGPTRNFDNQFPPSSTAANDLPGVALQWTVRSTNSANQRSVIIRGVPDARIINGEYFGSDAYNAAIRAYFVELMANWQFRTINRTLLPAKIISINDDGLVTCATPHGLLAGDHANVMSAIMTGGRKVSAEIVVITVPSTTTFTTFVPRRTSDTPIPSIYGTTRGRVRKLLIEYHNMTITNQEMIDPTATHRKAGSPFRKFRGRRTAKR